MRLGQLARQLEIKPEKIVSFLEKEKNITIKSHPNCKVQDELIDDITNHFKPSTEEVKEEPQEKKVSTIKKETAATSPKEETPAPIEHIETQKAPEPQELKIVGKIDLPNKKDITVEVDGVVYDQATLDEKKKEELKAEREKKAIEKEEKKKADAEKRRLAKEKREIEAERQAMLATEKSNQLTKEAEKKKALILKAQKEREEKLEKKRKEKQAEHYAKNFANKKSNNKKKKAKAIEQTEETTPNKPQEIAEIQETSLIKRFIKWLNT